jgi:hypothetical protein
MVRHGVFFGLPPGIGWPMQPWFFSLTSQGRDTFPFTFPCITDAN